MNDRDSALGAVLERLTPPLPDYDVDWEDVLRRPMPGAPARHPPACAGPPGS